MACWQGVHPQQSLPVAAFDRSHGERNSAAGSIGSSCRGVSACEVRVVCVLATPMRHMECKWMTAGKPSCLYLFFK